MKHKVVIGKLEFSGRTEAQIKEAINRVLDESDYEERVFRQQLLKELGL